MCKEYYTQNSLMVTGYTTDKKHDGISLKWDLHRLQRWTPHTGLFPRRCNVTGVPGFLPHETHQKNKSTPGEKYLNKK